MNTPLTRDQIEAKRADALAKQQAENKQLLDRQEAIHAIAYKLHQAAQVDDTVKEKPGFNVSLDQATKMVDAAIAEHKAQVAAAEAKAAAAAKAAADAKTAAEAAEANATAKDQAASASHEAAEVVEAAKPNVAPISGDAPADPAPGQS